MSHFPFELLVGEAWKCESDLADLSLCLMLLLGKDQGLTWKAQLSQELFYKHTQTHTDTHSELHVFSADVHTNTHITKKLHTFLQSDPIKTREVMFLGKLGKLARFQSYNRVQTRSVTDKCDSLFLLLL